PMSVMPQEMTAVSPYSDMSVVQQQPVKREEEYMSPFPYDRSGSVALSRPMHQRNLSVPSYLEYSPAPSFASSQLEDYNSRALSYEPVTPPQQVIPISEPQYMSGDALYMNDAYSSGIVPLP